MINAIYHCRMFATCFVQPLDLVKNRMQVCVVSDRSRPSSASVLMGVIRNEGFRTLYTGLSAGMLRQATYTTTRLGNWLYNKWINVHFTIKIKSRYRYSSIPNGSFSGTYQILFEKFSNKDGSPPSFLKKAALGMSAGACGAFVGTPAEISLIRMTSDGNLPAAERR